MSLNLKLNKVDQEKLENLFYVKDENILAARYFLHYLVNEPNLVKKDNLTNLIKKHFSEDDAFTETVLNFLSEDDKQIFSLLSSRVSYGFISLDEQLYKSNPYYQNIKVTKQKKWSWQLDTLSYHPYEGFSYRDIKVNSEDFKEVYFFGYFKNEFKYTILRYKNNVWMSITPHEIETMQASIDLVEGELIIFGLGLGYFPYMASLKEEVSKITIIEKDANVIKLFKKHLLPQFEQKDKITIIKANAFKYIKKMKNLNYTYAFVDIYQSVDDGLNIYLKMKQLERQVLQTKFLYWLEYSLLAMIRRAVLSILEETLNDSDNYLKLKGQEGLVFQYLNKKMGDLTFHTYEEVHDFIKANSLRNFL